MTKTVKKPGRSKLPEKEKKVQLTYYIPKMYKVEFEKAVKPYVEQYGTVSK